MKFFKNIIEKFAGKPVDWDELEEALIRSESSAHDAADSEAAFRNATGSAGLLQMTSAKWHRKRLVVFFQSIPHPFVLSRRIQKSF